MLAEDLHCYMKSYIQPFERRLAVAELASLTGTPAHEITRVNGQHEGISDEEIFRLPCDMDVVTLLKRLAYWEALESSGLKPTRQVLREATSNGSPQTGASQLPIWTDAPKGFHAPQRRCLRYGTHGLHEYRGKFFPQLVGALLNISGANEGAVVADPMCGSGTTLVESSLAGYKTYGLDLNPLSVFMAEVKCSLLSVNPDLLLGVIARFESWLASPTRSLRSHWTDKSCFRDLHDEDISYLERWFHSTALQQLGDIIDRICRVRDPRARNYLLLVTSNIVREVSWQKNEDLRVRRDPQASPLDVKVTLRRELIRHRPSLLTFLRQERRRNWTHGRFDVKVGDAREMTKEWRAIKGAVQVILTSPPYATALPYIDTDRLSLIILGLLSRTRHRDRERALIGNREVTERLRRAYWEEFLNERRDLPHQVTELVERIQTLNDRAKVGFRRRNLGALLAKYFLDMRDVFREAGQLLEPQGRMYVVIGSNRTQAGGKNMDIPTPSLLCHLAKTQGLRIGRRIPMEMLPSRGIFRNNAIPREEILEFTK